MCIPFQCPVKTEKKCNVAQASRKLESEKLDIKKGKHVSQTKNAVK
jgi:hypothetical protein